MGIVRRVIDAARGVNWKATQERQNFIRVNALCSAYENVFAQVRAMVDRMVEVPIYGVGRNGARLPLTRTPELAVLADPNDDFSSIEFLDAMFVTWLTEKELNVHVWRNGRGKVEGYSILPQGCRVPGIGRDKSDVFQFYTTNHGMVTLTEDEVMTLRFSRNPLDITEGVSPASSIFTWSQVDDLMAQLQKARLENGAYPATITFIRARNRADYEKKRKDLENGLKGARNANKTVYIYRQQLDDGTTGDELEVKTINSPNSQLAIKEIMEIVSDKINKAFGTSNFILGDDASAKYDNAELTNLQFLEHRVYPALIRFWSQFQHELDRITGGIGYAIQFDLAIPELTDRLKTKAEIGKINTEALTALISAGANATSAVRALGLGDGWQQAALGIYNRSLASNAANLTSAVDQNKNDDLKSPKGISSRLERTEASEHLPEKTTDDLPDDVYIPAFSEGEISEKKIYDKLMEVAEAIADDLGYDADEVAAYILTILAEDAAEGENTGAKKVSEIINDETAKAEIEKVFEEGGFKASPELTGAIQKRVDTLVADFTGETAKVVAETLSTARGEALSASQIKTRLAKVMPRHRAEMIARNEVGYAFEAGRLERDDQLAQQFGVKIAKVWRCHEGACPVCAAMDGEVVDLREAFPDHVEKEVDGEVQTFAFDHNEWNNDGEVPHAHVNCRCYFDEVIVS